MFDVRDHCNGWSQAADNPQGGKAQPFATRSLGWEDQDKGIFGLSRGQIEERDTA